LIVGGGPAGSSTAVALAARGVSTIVLDRARFPRPKPCAEYLSPQASRVLHEMGVLHAVESTGAAQLRGVTVRAPNGKQIHGEFLAKHGYTPFSERGLSIRREVLDELLLARARVAGADVRESTRVTDLTTDDGVVTGVRILENGNRSSIAARLVIGADGLRSTVARRLRLTQVARWPRRLALVTHFRGVEGITDVAEMHVERDGFIGIADVGHGLTTAALVVPASAAPEIVGDTAGFLTNWIESKPQLAPRFAAATRASPVRATGPFATHAKRAWAPGALLVGDAADFFDPFTGEGIYAALRGGELAAEAAQQALSAATSSARDRTLSAYDDARRKEFKGKWLIERFIAGVVASPFLINRAASSLSRRRDLADLLIGVTGDFVPPGEIVNARYVLAAFGLI
jgi:geranylgeranyl reductase family protein